MAKLTRGGGGSRPQKRQYRRFSLHYPVDVKFDLGTSVTELRTFSSNISLGGVLLQSDSAIPQHCDVSFVVTVRRHQIVGPIQIIGRRRSCKSGAALVRNRIHNCSEMQASDLGIASLSPSLCQLRRTRISPNQSQFLVALSWVKAPPLLSPNGLHGDCRLTKTAEEQIED